MPPLPSELDVSVWRDTYAEVQAALVELKAGRPVPADTSRAVRRRLAELYPEAGVLEAKAVRRVRTPEGADKYDQPIGSIIRPRVSHRELDDRDSWVNNLDVTVLAMPEDGGPMFTSDGTEQYPLPASDDEGPHASAVTAGVELTDPDGGEVVGHVVWHHDPGGPRHGEIIDLSVRRRYRRRGAATRLVDEALNVDPAVHHSEELTPDGQSFVRATPIEAVTTASEASDPALKKGDVVRHPKTGRPVVVQRVAVPKGYSVPYLYFKDQETGKAGLVRVPSLETELERVTAPGPVAPQPEPPLQTPDAPPAARARTLDDPLIADPPTLDDAIRDAELVAHAKAQIKRTAVALDTQKQLDDQGENERGGVALYAPNLYPDNDYAADGYYVKNPERARTGFTNADMARLEDAKHAYQMEVGRRLGWTEEETEQSLAWLARMWDSWRTNGGLSERRIEAHDAVLALRDGAEATTPATRGMLLQKAWTNATWNLKYAKDPDAPITISRFVQGEYAMRLETALATRGDDWSIETWPLTSWAVEKAADAVQRRWIGRDTYAARFDREIDRDHTWMLLWGEPRFRTAGLKAPGEIVPFGDAITPATTRVTMINTPEDGDRRTRRPGGVGSDSLSAQGRAARRVMLDAGERYPDATVDQLAATVQLVGGTTTDVDSPAGRVLGLDRRGWDAERTYDYADGATLRPGARIVSPDDERETFVIESFEPTPETLRTSRPSRLARLSQPAGGTYLVFDDHKYPVRKRTLELPDPTLPALKEGDSIDVGELRRRGAPDDLRVRRMYGYREQSRDWTTLADIEKNSGRYETVVLGADVPEWTDTRAWGAFESLLDEVRAKGWRQDQLATLTSQLAWLSYARADLARRLEGLRRLQFTRKTDVKPGDRVYEGRSTYSSDYVYVMESEDAAAAAMAKARESYDRQRAKILLMAELMRLDGAEQILDEELERARGHVRAGDPSNQLGSATDWARP